MIDRKKLVELIEAQMAVAKVVKSDFISLTVGQGKAILKELESSEAEMEGGGTSWWFVCGECHTAIDPKDKYCRECGRKIKWT